MSRANKFGCVIGVSMVCAVSSAQAQSQPVVKELLFSSAWSIPGVVSIEGNPADNFVLDFPHDDTPEPGFSVTQNVSVPKFNPAWGQLVDADFLSSGQGLFNWDMQSDMDPGPHGGSASNWGVHVRLAGGGADEATDGAPSAGGVLAVGFAGNSGGQGDITGIGFVSQQITLEIMLYHAIDGNGDGFANEEYDGSATTTVSGLASGLFQVLYTFTGPGPIPGDVTLDGFVSSGDLDVILGNWNQEIEGWNNGDLNGDGFVGAADLDIVFGNWNAGTPPAASLAPEPAGVVCLLGGLAGLLGRSSRAS